jgi:uncharacterized protein involved in exopolysaccharide biosynthesis
MYDPANLAKWSKELEEEIDLRPYLVVLIRRVKWILLSAVIAAVAVFIMLSLKPATYNATAVVLLIGESNLIQFDSRIRELPDEQPLKALPELALSDEILLSIQSKITLPSVHSLDDIREKITAEAGSDQSLILLSASDQDPDLAAQIANTWAAEFVAHVNAIYGIQNEDKITFFEAQLEQSATDLMAAEGALIDFQNNNRTEIISNTLTFDLQEHAFLLAERQELDQLTLDAQLLREQLITLPANIESSFSDQWTALGLQLQAFGAETASPLLIQADAAVSLVGRSRNEQIEFLERLVAALDEKQTFIDNRLEVLEPEILSLQGQLQEMQTNEETLVREKAITEETYITLSRKVQEERITSQDLSSGLRVISRAAVPTRPVNSSKLLLAIGTGLAVVFAGIFIVFISVWWQQNKEHLAK